jgi:hypothetical protein
MRIKDRVTIMNAVADHSTLAIIGTKEKAIIFSTYDGKTLVECPVAVDLSPKQILDVALGYA